jgi:hypothetical protein
MVKSHRTGHRETIMDKRLKNRSFLWGVPGILLFVFGWFLLVNDFAEWHTGSSIIQTNWHGWLKWPMVLLGSALVAAGMLYHLKGRHRHWAWVFLVLLGLPGLIVLLCLSDRELDDRELLEIDDGRS